MNTLLQVAARITKRLYSRLWRPWHGDGTPYSREAWEIQYRTGRWDYLHSLSEVDRYGVIVGYIRHFFEEAEILDIGCGHGRLLRLMHPGCIKRYTGVDVSQEAITTASRLSAAGALFVRADFEDWSPPDLVDVIVFNESLYYAGNPAATVTRYLSTLRVGGKIIVSMHEARNHHIIWRTLDSVLRRVHGVHIHTDRGERWTVRIFDQAAQGH